ncbi:hypothetical protein K8I31_01525 [bacterium]|nr:hypothetical protein [bacterium]
MLKNKLGFTKDQAQKLLYDYKSKGKQEPPEDEQKDSPSHPDDKGNVEQKISMIMNYMQETSTKLDQIEKDISYLKEQVDRILQKI